MLHPTQTRPLLSMTLIGGFSLRVGGRAVAALPRKARALLAYLAMQEGKPISREAMADLLWTDRGAEQARHSLRQTLLVLRRELKDAGEDLFRAEDRNLMFPAGAVETDVGRFRALAESADRATLAEAAALYSGPLLQGFPGIAADFDAWLERMRQDITDSALDVLGRLADECLAAGDLPAAVIATERMLGLDPLREDLHRRLMEVYARSGRRADAIRQYTECTELLRRDLDVGPSAETESLIRRIRTTGDAVELASPIQQALFAQPASGPPWIAVLPFHAFDGEPVPSHLSDGLVADIVYQLVGLRELNVISHGSTMGLRDRYADLRQIGRNLGARYLVRGTIRSTGHQVRLMTELTEAETGAVIWARSNDTNALLSFQDQDRIVAQIVNTLAPRVREVELHRIRGKRLENLSMYEKVLLARERLMHLERHSFMEAKILLDEVTAAEPTWAEGHAMAADWHGLHVAQGWSTNRAADIEGAERLTRKALSLDADNVRALVFSGHRKSLLHRDYGAALEQFQRALEVAPSSVHAWLWSSYTFSYLGDPAEAVTRAERALALSPFDREGHRFLGALCVAYYTAGDYEAAAAWGQRALAEPNVGRTTGGWTAAALAAHGQIREAREVVAHTMARWPDRRVRDIVANHPYKDPERRRQYGVHLIAAGFPE